MDWPEHLHPSRLDPRTGVRVISTRPVAAEVAADELKRARAIARAMSTAHLVQLLRAHNMKTSHALRDELVERVAWAAVNGCLPQCPVCHQGYLRWHAEADAFRCPGQYDSTMKGVTDCSYTVAGDRFVRPVWSWSGDVDHYGRGRAGGVGGGGSGSGGSPARPGVPAAVAVAAAAARGVYTRSPVRVPDTGVLITGSPQQLRQ